MFELTVEVQFSAAHQLRGYPGPCARVHGHNYRVLVTVAGDQLNEQGMLIDFGELKAICGEVIAPFDHAHLNELPAFAEANPTAEALARYICREVSSRLGSRAGGGIRVPRVTVYESDRSFATYEE